MNLDFKNELAAKLNAGPLSGGFVGFRKSAPHSGALENEDSTHAAEPTSPATCSAPESPLTDTYLEHALLRINLNKQRRHRPCKNLQHHQTAPAAIISSNLFTAPLDNITEEGDFKEVTSDSQPTTPTKPHETVIILRPKTNESKRAISEIVRGSPASAADQRADLSRFSSSTERVTSLASAAL